MADSPFPTFETMFPTFLKSWMNPNASTKGSTGSASTPGQGEATPTPSFVGGNDTGGIFDNFDSDKFRSEFRFNLAQNFMGQLFPEVHPVLLSALLRKSMFPQPGDAPEQSWAEGWGDVFGGKD